MLSSVVSAGLKVTSQDCQKQGRIWDLTITWPETIGF